MFPLLGLTCKREINDTTHRSIGPRPISYQRDEYICIYSFICQCSNEEEHRKQYIRLGT